LIRDISGEYSEAAEKLETAFRQAITQLQEVASQ